MEVYRLIRNVYKDQLNGIGASSMGGRWNSKGIRIVYAAANRSIAMAEVAVHMSIGDLPTDYFMITIHVPDGLTQQHISESELPVDWKLFPHSEICRSIGDQFIFKQKYCVLRVPSAVTLGDYNMLLNPNHPEFSQVNIISAAPFPFDNRIIERR